MKLWHTVFILSLIVVYGALSLALLGRWIWRTARSFRDTRRPPSQGDTPEASNPGIARR
ncbi:MAG: hypothetical protein ACE5JS_20655 [Nitrospinota bacterium]